MQLEIELDYYKTQMQAMAAQKIDGEYDRFHTLYKKTIWPDMEDPKQSMFKEAQQRLINTPDELIVKTSKTHLKGEFKMTT